MKRMIKEFFNTIGFDIVRLNKSPKISFFGLKKYEIRTIIDVGANEGQFAGYISKIFSEANIFCFEPLPEAFKELSKWAESKNGKVKAFNLALGDYE